MKTILVIALCILLFGCPGIAPNKGGNIGTGGDENPPAIEEVTKCTDVTYEMTKCSNVPYDYSTTGISKQNQYMLGDFCVGGAKVTLRNLEKQNALFKVTFVFETPIEGKISKTVEKQIASKGAVEFEEKAQFRCAQEYTVDFRVTAPTKQSCRIVNETRQECVVDNN